MARVMRGLAVAALLFLSQAAHPQEAPKPPPAAGTAKEGAPATGKEAETAEAAQDKAFEEANAAYRKIVMIEIVQALRLRREQVVDLVRLMRAIQKDRVEILATDRNIRSRELDRVDRVVNAWAGLEAVPPQAVQEAWGAVRRYLRDVAPREARISALTNRAINEVLDAEQRDALETAAERLAKLSRAERLLDKRFVDVKQVVQSLRRAAALPDETYREQRDDLAEKIAIDVAGANSEYLEAVKRRVRLLLDDSRTIGPNDWEPRAAEIENRVRRFLGVEDEETKSKERAIRPDVIAESAFRAFMRDPVGLELLEHILEITAPDEKKGGAKP